jgi:hypothetical protein
MTDHGRLLATTHNHARDGREDDSCDGGDGRHDRGFEEETVLEYNGES